MSLPTLSKTWQFAVNQSQAAQGSSQSCQRLLIYNLIQSLIGNAPTYTNSLGASITPTHMWQVRGSSNGTSASLLALSASGPGTNYITSPSNLIGNNNGSAHSWIVLRQTGLGGTYSEILITCNSAYSSYDLSYISVYVTPSQGFTGGSNTTDPTLPSDCVAILNTNNYGNDGTNRSYTLHVMTSSDGQCTRAIFCYGSDITGYMFVENAQSPISGWSAPNIFGSFKGTMGTNLTTRSNYYNSISALAYINGTASLMYFTGETCIGISPYLITDVYTGPNALSGNYPMLPIGVYSYGYYNNYSGSKGRYGTMYDLWWGSSANATGTVYPGTTSADFSQFGELILPWNGSTPSIT